MIAENHPRPELRATQVRSVAGFAVEPAAGCLLEALAELHRHPFDGQLAPSRISEELRAPSMAIAARDVATAPLAQARNQLGSHPIGDALSLRHRSEIARQVTVRAADPERERRLPHPGLELGLAAGM